MPYYFSSRYFLNSWPMKSDPWSYVISVGLRYLVNHLVSTKSAIYIALLSSYCIISNRYVTGFITVTAFRFNFFLSLPFYDVGTYYIYTDCFPWYFLSLFIWKLNIFNIWPFCTLASVKMIYFLPDGIYNNGPVQMLTNHCLCSIHYWMKEIRMVPI